MQGTDQKLRGKGNISNVVLPKPTFGKRSFGPLSFVTDLIVTILHILPFSLNLQIYIVNKTTLIIKSYTFTISTNVMILEYYYSYNFTISQSFGLPGARNGGCDTLGRGPLQTPL